MISVPTVFLDRDGIINTSKGFHVNKLEDFELIPGAIKFIKYLNDNHIRVVVVTNQAGRSNDILQIIHSAMFNELLNKGAFVDGIYICKHMPSDNCDCRKPKPGMLLQAQRELGIDFMNSVMIGDNSKDISAGATVGCITCLLVNKLIDIEECSLRPDYCISDISQAEAIVQTVFKDYLEG